MSEKIRKLAGKELHYDYECVMCGECCRAGYKVFIKPKDVERWKHKEKFDFLKYFQIDPDSISEKDSTIYQEKDGKAILEIRKNFKKNYQKKLKELIGFIEKNHIYRGADNFPHGYYTILPNMRKNPILTPKNYDIMLDGINKKKINYIITLDSVGKCPFLNLNQCLINHLKPEACKRFPFKKDGTLRDDDYFFTICRGIKKSSL